LKEEGRRKKEEGRRKTEEGRKKERYFCRGGFYQKYLLKTQGINKPAPL